MNKEKRKQTSMSRRLASYEVLVRRYTEFVLWFLDPVNKTQYRKLAKFMTLLLQRSGPVYTVAYLKECQRLVNHYLAGTPTSCPQGELRVSSRRGLPLIVPGPLRLLMEVGDGGTIRTVLTLLSFFRVIKCPGILKLSSITDGSKGVNTTLDPVEVAWVWAKKFAGKVPPKPFGLETLLILKSSGPNFKTSILGAPLDALAWKTIATDDLRKAFQYLSDYFSSPLWACLQSDMETVSGWSVHRDLRLGKLSKKLEPAGKIRVFAMTDVWTQSVLEPIHRWVFKLLESLSDVDGTFDQAAPLRSLQDKLSKKTDKFAASYDLSAATDRLPIDLQVQVLSQLTGDRQLAESWKTLLIGRGWWLGSEELKYSVGQPMGALSSWGMLALTHHFIVQVAASRVGKTTWFADYAILGDDVVIADKAVANCYLSLMTEWLGVEINLGKSIISESGTLEFAKRVITPRGEFSPLGANNIINCLRNKGNIVSIFRDYLGKGGLLNWAKVEEQLKRLSHRTDILSIRSKDIVPLTWSLVAPFGPIHAPDLVPVRATRMLGDVGLDRVIGAFRSALLADMRATNVRVLDKARPVFKEVMESLDDFGPKLQIGVTPDVELVCYSMLRSDYEARFEKLNDLFSSYIEMLEDEEDEWLELNSTESDLVEFLKHKLSKMEVSPLDNPFVRPRVIQPRLEDRFLGLAKGAIRHLKKYGDRVLPPQGAKDLLVSHAAALYFRHASEEEDEDDE